MFKVVAAGKIISLHLTAKGAAGGLRRYWQEDKTGVTAFIEPSVIDGWSVGTVICMAVIGVLLAWRG